MTFNVPTLQCPVGCGALVVSCPQRVGSVLLPAGAWLISEVRSHQDQRQEAKVKSEGKKNIILKCGPWQAEDKRRKYTTMQRLSPYSK